MSLSRLEQGRENAFLNRLSDVQVCPYLFTWGGWIIPTARVISISHFTFKGNLVDPRLRASNEALLRARVARAKETSGPPLLSYIGPGTRTVGLVDDRTHSSSTDIQPATYGQCRPTPQVLWEIIPKYYG